MDLSQLQHFLLVPSAQSAAGGVLHLLEPATAYAPNSFVLLPYNRPGAPLSPQFFKVREKKNFTYNWSTGTPPPLVLNAALGRADYLARFAQLMRHIRRGDIYEINFCQLFTAEQAEIDPVATFFRLLHITKAPYAALLKTGKDYLLCASPELFLKKEGQQLFTKPIKGTIRRGKTPEEDAALKNSLYHSLKERTENVMAVDVARNDLSQIAERGTVQVNGLYTIETFETVHQMVSTVSCTLRPGVTFAELLNATFPMASMTGAPKLSARQLADRYEGFERGMYSGAMGLVDAHGDFTLGVVIRSILYNQEQGRVSIAAGSALTHLSEGNTEYEECLLKAQSMLKALNASLAP